MMEMGWLEGQEKGGACDMELDGTRIWRNDGNQGGDD